MDKVFEGHDSIQAEKQEEERKNHKENGADKPALFADSEILPENEIGLDCSFYAHELVVEPDLGETCLLPEEQDGVHESSEAANFKDLFRSLVAFHGPKRDNCAFGLIVFSEALQILEVLVPNLVDPRVVVLFMLFKGFDLALVLRRLFIFLQLLVQLLQLLDFEVCLRDFGVELLNSDQVREELVIGHSEVNIYDLAALLWRTLFQPLDDLLLIPDRLLDVVPEVSLEHLDRVLLGQLGQPPKLKRELLGLKSQLVVSLVVGLDIVFQEPEGEQEDGHDTDINDHDGNCNRLSAYVLSLVTHELH